MKNKITDLLEDFGVSNEDELLKELVEESLTIPCIICGREFSPELLDFSSDDPICENCR